MKCLSDGTIRDFQYVAAVLFALSVAMPAIAQQDRSPNSGLVDDWTHRHVIFSDPAPLLSGMNNEKREEWQHIVNNHRYRMQQIRRNFMWAAQRGRMGNGDLQPMERDQFIGPLSSFSSRLHDQSSFSSGSQGKWTVPLSASTNPGVAAAMYPAKYTFSPTAAPSCANDYVLFPINNAGSVLQANILGVNNLYAGTCTGTVPTVRFAYHVGSGKVQTSPVLSEDGTKTAFIESVTNGSIFHVLILDQRGNGGCLLLTSPCNGSSYLLPATPGTNNNAVDMKVTMSGNVSVTRSSPFVDYEDDIAYVGDDSGKLHKFTPIFNATSSNPPKEIITGGWPFTVASGAILTGPVYDGGASQSIFVGSSSGSTGSIYCITPAGAFCSKASIVAGTGINDAPIVDSTKETVFVTTDQDNSGGGVIVFQTPTSFSSSVTAAVGTGGSDQYNGTFDNAYYNSPSSGHMYVCGGSSTTATPRLWAISFSSQGIITGTPAQSVPLVTSGNGGTGVDCSPLTEVFNPSTNIDLLFLSVKSHGAPTSCTNAACVMSFNITNGVPAAALFATALTTSTTAVIGTSGIVIDNVSSSSGSSQIYFGQLSAGLGEQLSQSGLQ